MPGHIRVTHLKNRSDLFDYAPTQEHAFYIHTGTQAGKLNTLTHACVSLSCFCQENIAGFLISETHALTHTDAHTYTFTQAFVSEKRLDERGINTCPTVPF